MKFQCPSCLLPLLISLSLLSACSNDTDTQEAVSLDARISGHIDIARQLAGNDLTAPFDFFCIPENTRANNRDAPNLEPVQLFDNLYALGHSETVVYVLPTSEGIVLLDAGYADIVETVLVDGLRELGFDPADVRYILLGHGHADHFGGAAYFQTQYGTRIGITDTDWTLMEERAQNARPGDAPIPARDIIIRDGEPIQVGELTITPIAIPGHTPGALAYIFPVTDNGTPHVAGLFAGTVLIAERVSTPNLRQYISSIANYVGIAESMGVDVEIQNHPLFDNTPERIAALVTRSANGAHPFVMGTSNYVRFWSIISECMQADILRRELP